MYHYLLVSISTKDIVLVLFVNMYEASSIY